MPLDYYNVLGLSPSASGDEIKRAYRKLAILYHPDKNPDPKVAERFKEITEAYNTLGDEESRRIYDLRFSSAFSEVLQSEPEVQQDPRYRRRRPQASRVQNEKWTMKELISVGVFYTRYCSYAGLLVVFLLAADFLLPYLEHNDTVADIYSVRYRRGTAFTVVKTEGGKRLKMYKSSASCFEIGDSILVRSTLIYRIPMILADPLATNVSEVCSSVRMGYIYRTQIFFPIILLLLSILGVIRQVSLETNFNFGIGAGVFLLIHIYLLY